MHTNITRGQALNLLKKYNQEPFHLLHALTVEAVMRYLAVQLGYADETDFWGLEKVLFATDELTGLIGAAAKMRPSKSTQDMEVSSLKKKFKDKKFAAGCSRDIIKQGADMLGWPLEELFEKTLSAMRETEKTVLTESEELTK